MGQNQTRGHRQYLAGHLQRGVLQGGNSLMPGLSELSTRDVSCEHVDKVTGDVQGDAFRKTELHQPGHSQSDED